MSVESLRVKQKSLRSSFTMCCTSIEEALKKDTTLTDLYALQRQIMDKFTRLDTVQEHILELLLSVDLVSSEYEEDFTKAEKYRDKMNQLSAELELVNSFPPTKENYSKAVQQVKERLGREDLLVQIYIRDLLGLIMQNANGKIKLELAELYDVLKSKLLALESLGRTQEKFADFLESLVESCLSETVLRAWERCRNTDPTSEGLDSGRTLDRLMTFLRKEVESEEMILLARTGLGSPQRQKSKATVEEPFLATSAALVNTKGGRSGKQKFCLFCSQCNHWSFDCLIGKKLSLNDKKSILIRNRACFRCLNKGHNARSCRLKMLKCMNCDDKSHHTLLCNKNEEFDLKNETVGATISNSLANQSLITNVYLQTIVLKLCYNNNEMVLRCLLDNGSQKSYLTQRVIDHLNLKPVSKQTIVHGLFGGRETAPRKHFLYNVIIKSKNNSFSCQIKVLSEEKICGYLPKVNDLQVLSEIKENGILVPDLCNSVNEIDMLLGADVINVILSGRTIKLMSGLIAIGTMLGFTLMGKPSQIVNDNNEISVPTTRERQLSMFLNQLNVKELWDIETIGIRDPVENVKSEIQHSDMIERFQKNIETLPNGRYEVALPFKIEGQLTDNK
ncbi:putative RNA-directed DNA polymerase from transposon X-element, partial [Nephila pilipes]